MRARGRWYVGPDNGVFAYVAERPARPMRSRTSGFAPSTSAGRSTAATCSPGRPPRSRSGEDPATAGPRDRARRPRCRGGRASATVGPRRPRRSVRQPDHRPAARPRPAGGGRVAGLTLPIVGDLRGRAEPGELLAYIGSAGTVEIAVRDGRADRRLPCRPRRPIVAGAEIEPACAGAAAYRWTLRRSAPLTARRLDITALAAGGDGVGRDAGGRVTFVPRAAPGDRVRARSSTRRRRSRAPSSSSCVAPGAARVAPACPHFVAALRRLPVAARRARRAARGEAGDRRRARCASSTACASTRSPIRPGARLAAARAVSRRARPRRALRARRPPTSCRSITARSSSRRSTPPTPWSPPRRRPTASSRCCSRTTGGSRSPPSGRGAARRGWSGAPASSA